MSKPLDMESVMSLELQEIVDVLLRTIKDRDPKGYKKECDGLAVALNAWLASMDADVLVASLVMLNCTANQIVLQSKAFCSGKKL